MKTLILVFFSLIFTQVQASVISLKGVDIDGMDCTLEIQESVLNKDSYLIIINEEDKYIIAKTDFSDLKDDEITRIKTSNSTINGTRDLIIEFKPNYETIFTILQKDLINFETSTYKCSQLKSSEK